MEDRGWQKVDEWMRQYGDRIMRTVCLMVEDHHLAEEITQEVFVNSYQSLSSFRGDSSPYTWLYRIAINLSRNHLRRKKILRFLPLVDEDRQTDVLQEPLEEKVARVTTGRKVRDCIKQLPLIYREVIILHYYEEMKISEIAEVLQQPEGTVKSKLARGRDSLQNIMRKEGLVYEE